MTEFQYHGELWRGNIEQSLLPELIPAEHFENPLFAKMAEIWWSSDTPELSETLPDALEQLTVEQKLALAKYVEDAGIEDPCGEHVTTIWGKPLNITVGEDRIVRAEIGSVSDIDEAVLHNHAIADHLLSNVDDGVYAAAHRWQGPDFARSIQISEETMRRYELATQKRLAAEAAVAEGS
jgi:hypothetical protein